MGVYIEGLDMPKEHSLWMVINPNGQVWMRKRHYCQNLEGVEATGLDLVRCGECKRLEVINKAPIYAHCHKWDYDFELWQEDTRTNFCSWGERRSE